MTKNQYSSSQFLRCILRSSFGVFLLVVAILIPSILQKCDKSNFVGMSKQVTTLPNSNRMSLTHHRRL